MQIVIVAATESCDRYLLKGWASFYQKSQSTLPVTLLYDKNVDCDILNSWPYTKQPINLKYTVNPHDSITFIDDIKKFFYLDTLKMSAYRHCGDCIVVDYDTVIKKKLTIDNIPECEIGACLHHETSNFFDDKMLMSRLTHFDEYDFVPHINLGFMIQKKDPLNLYLEYCQKYFSKIKYEAAMECFGQSIASLTFRTMNAVYLDASWNWYYDSKYPNNQVIMEHYWSRKAKEKLIQIFKQELKML